MMTLKQILLQRWMGAKSQCTSICPCHIWRKDFFHNFLFIFTLAATWRGRILL